MEAGDTLGVWHVVVSAAPIANLHSNDAALIEDRIELPATRAKYWRLSWVGTPPPFELISAAAEPQATGDLLERSRLAVIGDLVRDTPGEFQFDIGARPWQILEFPYILDYLGKPRRSHGIHPSHLQ